MTTIASPSTQRIGVVREPVSLGALLRTKADWGTSLLRLTLGIVMFPHGAQKLLGWFGGYGYRGTMDFFTHPDAHPRPVRLSGHHGGVRRIARADHRTS
jgi:hypothetical protein